MHLPTCARFAFYTVYVEFILLPIASEVCKALKLSKEVCRMLAGFGIKQEIVSSSLVLQKAP